MAKVGRPAIYTKELAEKFCKRISEVEFGFHKVCKEEGMPSSATINSWLNNNPEFVTLYARAKEEQHDMVALKIIEISDNENQDLLDGQFGMVANSAKIARDKLRTDNRKWLLAKLAPKKYGDKVEITIPKIGKDLADEQYTE